MNTALLTAFRQIVSQHGGVETLSDARRVKALLADLAAKEPKPQKNALIACLEEGFAALLQNIPPAERGPAKAKLAERLNREEGLDPALCADTLDLLEAALFGAEKDSAETTGSGNRFCTACGAALPGEARFCPACGTAVASPAARPAPPNVPNQQPVTPAYQEKEAWRLLRTIKEHQVHSVVYSPDGRRIVCRALDTIKIWDAESGQKLLTLADDYWGLTPAAYSSDGRRIASSSTDEIITIWDAESGRELQTLSGHTGLVYSVAFSPGGRRIVSGSRDKTITIWDAESGRELHTLKGHTDVIWSVAYSPDGRRIVSGAYDKDKTLKIWDAESGRELHTLKGHTDGVSSVMYSPDGRRIASGSTDETIKIWGME